MKKVLSVALLSIVLIAFAACGGKSDKSKEIALKLEDFKSGNEYQYAGVEYGLSVFEFTKITPFIFKRDETKPESSDEYDFFKSVDTFVLDNESATGAIEFQDGKFNTIRFDFVLHENYQEWFDAQVKKLTELYGKETEKSNNENDRFKSTIYKWETDTTVLNLILIEGDNPSCTIGTFKKP